MPSNAGKKKRKKNPRKQVDNWAIKAGFGKKTAKLLSKVPPPPPKPDADFDPTDPKGRKKKKKQGPNSLMPYNSSDTMLLVGEGDFSFAAALTSVIKSTVNVTATSFDSQAHMTKKYDTGEENIDNFKAGGGFEHFNVDATKLEANANLGSSYDCIVFNFPHCGSGIKDKLKNVQGNQQLLNKFFQSAMKVLHPQGEIHITIKKGEPYNSWGLIRLGTKVNGLRVKNSFDFNPKFYPGYAHRRTIGHKEGLSTSNNEEIMKQGARTVVFAFKKLDHQMVASFASSK